LYIEGAIYAPTEREAREQAWHILVERIDLDAALSLRVEDTTMAGYSISLERAVRFRLTRREQQALLLVAQGLSTEEIAKEMDNASGTIRSHVASLKRKLSARGRAQLVLRALEEGVLTTSHEV
jgi:DNA-binding NarL/FixJ family response regulator